MPNNMPSAAPFPGPDSTRLTAINVARAITIGSLIGRARIAGIHNQRQIPYPSLQIRNRCGWLPEIGFHHVGWFLQAFGLASSAGWRDEDPPADGSQ
ncbi:MAG: hypothetical protein VKI81_00855 [Synechococcaceae cyanobacterium]|nr:hypothetical protein [Synechococcaceae cyanobacterium]